ncbi:hypothetical protein E2C01_025426 [Portunus trituberculatus]|uniref:Uncharacterized protein n=1 Tax=Portunus trituberculatus TaxID=210409 RepID=A0A5B7EDB8_PORTR|nr:hypothetical protein [Portunus trituberculatus]
MIPEVYQALTCPVMPEPLESHTTLPHTQFLRLDAKPHYPNVPATVHPNNTRHIKAVRGPYVDSSCIACLCDRSLTTTPLPAVGIYCVYMIEMTAGEQYTHPGVNQSCTGITMSRKFVMSHQTSLISKLHSSAYTGKNHL